MLNKNWSDLIKEHKTFFTIVIVGFFLLEIQIFAVAVMKSGRQSWMNVIDDSGEIIYQVKGSTLTNFNKYYFENTFGSIDDYKVRLVSKDVSFPFREWFAAAIGIPVGVILLLAFVLKAIMALLYGKKSALVHDDDDDDGYDDQVHQTAGKQNGVRDRSVRHGKSDGHRNGKSDAHRDGTSYDEDAADATGEKVNPEIKHRGSKAEHSRSKKKSRQVNGRRFGTAASAESVLNLVSRLNIFIIGFMILCGVMLYIVIPDLLTFLAKVGIETILNFKWFFLAVLIALFLLFAWFMYMKYQLARKSMDAQTEIRKYEIKMEYTRYDNALPAPEKSRDKSLMIEYSDADYEEMESPKQ